MVVAVFLVGCTYKSETKVMIEGDGVKSPYGKGDKMKIDVQRTMYFGR